MKTWKIVSGILSCLFPLVILLQSCAATVGGALEENEELVSGGGAGIFVAILMLAGGIVSIVTRDSGGQLPIMIIYGLGAFFGIIMASTGFTDLAIWGAWCLICGVSGYIDKREKNKFVCKE